MQCRPTPTRQNQQVTRAQGEERQHVPLPVYLRRRKRELSEERRRAAEPPEPEPPPGYRRVGAEEQQQAIETLSRRREAVVKSQDKLPFRIETIGQRQREKDLKERLQHLDKLISMFSKPVVFVPADSEPISDVVRPPAAPVHIGPAPVHIGPAPVELSPRRAAEMVRAAEMEIDSEIQSTMLPGNSLAPQKHPPDVMRHYVNPKIDNVNPKIDGVIPTGVAGGPFCRLPMQPPGGHARICLSWD